jgi:hypothetical protein
MRTLTTGTVVDTNDPKQLGRIKVHCAEWDSKTSLVDNLPWTMYCSPFGGTVTRGTRGPENDPVGLHQQSAYGMWAIPKIGATVVVGILNNDSDTRVWLGCTYTDQSTHTLPHGRYISPRHPIGLEDGPLDSSEQYINPLHKHMAAAFFSEARPVGSVVRNLEWQSRGADFQACGVTQTSVDSDDLNISQYADDFKYSEGKTSTDKQSRQGYAESEVQRNVQKDKTEGKTLESTVYSMTSPGFHAMSMDDREENCRMRFRTTGGHQIILDDTNERIYVATAEGNSWVELDQNGNIDIYSARRISIHSESDISMKSEKSIRMQAKTGIHMFSEKDVNIEARTNCNMRAENNIEQRAGNLYRQESKDFKYHAFKTIIGQAGQSVSLHGGNHIKYTAAKIDFNGPTATIITPYETGIESGKRIAKKPQPPEAQLVVREPQHEPWPRAVKRNDKHTWHESELHKQDKAFVNQVVKSNLISKFKISTNAADILREGIIHPDMYYDNYFNENINQIEFPGDPAFKRNKNWKR